MKTYCCKECKQSIDRDREMYNVPLIQDPLWLHLKDCNEELFKLMADFDNPYDIECLYVQPDELILTDEKYDEMIDAFEQLTEDYDDIGDYEKQETLEVMAEDYSSDELKEFAKDYLDYDYHCVEITRSRGRSR